MTARMIFAVVLNDLLPHFKMYQRSAQDLIVFWENLIKGFCTKILWPA